MPEIDQRFLTPHPATALWWEQREKCEKCVHLNRQSYAIRCTKTTSIDDFRKSVSYAYCIDARLEGAPCGPNAALFKPKD